MAEIVLRPDLKTAGGEVSDILFQGRYAGTLLLVYRENDRVSGSVQLEKDSLTSKQKKAVLRHVTDYIQSTIHAVKAAECDVLVTYSSFEQVISTGTVEDEMLLLDEDEAAMYDDEPEVIWVTDDDDISNWEPDEAEVVLAEEDEDEARYYELVPTKETATKIEYHVYDENRDWVAEVLLRPIGGDLIGDIHWVFEPSEEEVAQLTDLIVSDFDESTVDSIALDHRFEGQIIESVELTHEDLLDEDEYRADSDAGAGRAYALRGTPDELEEYTVVLARDDQDMLTYEIYKQSEGGLPIGTATVDISRKQLAGFIDFRSPVAVSGERERIASLVMQELDKEKDYSTISFTMLEGNRPIDEVVFENEPVH